MSVRGIILLEVYIHQPDLVLIRLPPIEFFKTGPHASHGRQGRHTRHGHHHHDHRTQDVNKGQYVDRNMSLDIDNYNIPPPTGPLHLGI